MTPPVLLYPDWPAPANIRAFFTTRQGGASQGDFAGFNLGRGVPDDPAAVEANRAALRAELPGDATWLRQVHGPRCVQLPSSGDLTADAAWTTDIRQVCMVQVADCMPVFLTRQDGGAVAVAHAGWRGLAGGVLESTVAALRTDAANPVPLMAWMGPCIGPLAFEVGPEVRDAFLDVDPGCGHAFLDRGSGKWLCNLSALARRRLNRAGVTAVFGGNFCTYTDAERFFSYRRATHEGRATGRMAAVIWREC
ncbi:MAG: peptidoglycan editing factor PgeF [Betaproteobacteria bacterium]|nr:peptidoglycan editing factor PgeF [Betaproteobacteria bacterium]